MRNIFLRLLHLPLLAAWAVSLYCIGHTLPAEYHFQNSQGLSQEPEKQAAEINRALDLDPLNGLAHALKGRGMLEEKKYAAAIEHTKRALELRFTLEIAKQLASAYFLSGDILLARREFRKIAVYMPFDNEALYRLAHFEILLDQPEMAEKLAFRHLDYHSRSPEIYWIIGKSYELRKRNRLAMHWMHRFLMQEPTGVVPDQVYDYLNWEWLKTWDIYIRDVETGKIVPQPGADLDKK